MASTHIIYVNLNSVLSHTYIHMRNIMSYSRHIHHVHMAFFLIPCLFFFLINPSTSSPDSSIYVGCSQQSFDPATPYQSNLNSMLASLVNSASISNFNSFKISSSSSNNNDVVYGLYQCRGDLTNSDCRACVASAVNRLGTFCIGTSGGALQLDGCFIKYDSAAFLGAQDKAVVSSKCGPAIGYGSDLVTRRDAVLAYLTEGGGGQYFRVGGSGKVQGMVQCVQDLSGGECQECLSEAIQRLKSGCGAAPWGDVFLGKCYARYSERGYSSSAGSGARRRGWLWWWMVFVLTTKIVLF